MNPIRFIKASIRRFLQILGFRVVKIKKGVPAALDGDLTVYPYDISEDENFINLYESCRNHSMVSIERMFSLYQAVEYIVKNNISGDIVECGVWKGGSCMMAASVLCDLKQKDRKIYLFDTFAGMTQPHACDIRHDGLTAQEMWESKKKEQYNSWAYSPIQEVRKNMLLTGYPENQLVFVKGDVKNTIPQTAPRQIALLRLDTDWYDSTYHELEHLYPLLSPGGVLILDDYGCWKGARKAVDEYFSKNSITLLLHRIDEAGRIGIK